MKEVCFEVGDSITRIGPTNAHVKHGNVYEVVSIRTTTVMIMNDSAEPYYLSRYPNTLWGKPEADSFSTKGMLTLLDVRLQVGQEVTRLSLHPMRALHTGGVYKVIEVGPNGYVILNDFDERTRIHTRYYDRWGVPVFTNNMESTSLLIEE